MIESCCASQNFVRNADPAVADIGSAAGAEFTIGSCTSCQHPLINVFISAANESVTLLIEPDFLTDLIATTDATSRKAMLKEWWESR
jgi:hypothetical protein